MSCEVRDIIVEKWLEGSKPFQIGLQLNLPKKTVSNIVDRFVHTGSVQPGVGGNKIRTARTDDVVLYTEFCKRQRPSVYAVEVQKGLIENQVVLPANVLSRASISRVLTSDLGYSYKKMTIVPKESLWFPSRSSRRNCVAKYAWLEWCSFSILASIPSSLQYM